VNNVKFSDYSNISITIQHRLLILGSYIDNGGYMSVRHVSSDFNLIFMVL
jgi:hypothetical protein